MSIDAIKDDFDFLDDWEDRYRYVIELGRKLEPLPEGARSDANKVQGCVSQVWIDTQVQTADNGTPMLSFVGDSDAMIVKGLIAILLELYSDRSAEDILKVDSEAALGELGLQDHLTPQRSNGLRSMVERIKADARGALETAA